MALQKIPTDAFKGLSTAETLAKLGASEAGLAGEEVAQRRAFYGRNEITEKQRSPLLGFLGRYWGPMPWLLELAMVLAFVLGRATDGYIILALLTLNAVVGFTHERSAAQAVALLKQRLSITAKVKRAGKWQPLPAGEIVPGDIIAVKLGDIVPADLKLIDGEVSVDESALTGESLAREKQANALLYSGSVIRRGETEGIALNTGAQTHFGRTAELVKGAKPKSHQMEIMMAIVKYMLYLGILASLVIAVSAAAAHLSVVLILTFIVIFLMAAIPAALPAVTAIVQAATSVTLAKAGVLVARLDAVEDAASVTVLCLDKTGTITENRLAVAENAPAQGYTADDVLRFAALASKAETMDPIDLAVLDRAKTADLDMRGLKQTAYTPFSPETKRTEGRAEGPTGKFFAVKGAEQIVLPLCQRVTAADRTFAEKTVAEFSEKGYRALAVAQAPADDRTALAFVGLIALADPPRPDSKEMIEEIRALGIRPIMLTGDNLAIAREVAAEVSIGQNIVRFSDIKDLPETEQAKWAGQTDGFAEIYPEDKYKIVKMLQGIGHQVGMTGDGVNDAPALKQAELGIAVQNATDVAKAAASVVLTEPGVSVIAAAVKRSRETYQRMLTWVVNKVTKVVQAVGLLVAGFFMTGHLVLSLLGMALLVFVNDFATITLATDNVETTASPDEWNVKNITLASLIIGAIFALEGVIAVIWARDYLGLGLLQVQTVAMLTLIFTSQFKVLSVRERRFFWSSAPGKLLIASSLGAIILFVLIGGYGAIVPALPWNTVFILLGFSAGFTILMDPLKYLAFKLFSVK